VVIAAPSNSAAHQNGGRDFTALGDWTAPKEMTTKKGQRRHEEDNTADRTKLFGAKPRSRFLNAPRHGSAQKQVALAEISLPTIRCDHRTSGIKNAHFTRLRPAVKFRVTNGGVGLLIPEATEWQRLGNQIKAPTIFARRTS
jgi:hypothetical protein